MSSDKYQMLAKTLTGLEEVLKAELEELGASKVEAVVRGVKFSGSKEILYKANFCCRTATSIQRIIGEYPISNPTDLYDSINSIEWENHFDVTQSFAIISTATSDAFNNSMFVSLKTKDAIVDRFRAKTKKRPSNNTEKPDFTINTHASSDTLTVSIDSSGESLSNRGYKLVQNDASLNGVLVAGILKITGWKGQTDFYDTMCGSGTIPIEAALIARNIPPGIFRSEFAFEKWKDFDSDLFEEVYNDDYEIPFEHNIYASDISEIGINVAMKNAKSAGVIKTIDFKALDFSAFKPEKAEGLLVINPPIGEKMNERKVDPLYEMIGGQLKRNFVGIKAWVFSNYEDGFKKIGLRPSERIPLYNGALECSLRLFEVYSGVRKDTEEQEEKRSDSFQAERKEGGFRSTDSRSEGRPEQHRERRSSEGFRSGRRSEGFQSDKRRNEDRFERKGSDFKPNRRTSEFGGDTKRSFDKPSFKRDGNDSKKDFSSKPPQDNTYDSGIQVTTFESKSDKKPVDFDKKGTRPRKEVDSNEKTDGIPKARGKRPRTKKQ
ncbi:MAG: class I SAM-dependent RNA methyltransferase [Prolixibacteraceae bacterium]|jgi:putative N6-adenine-specific DNA methylase|nr:class I SAM-dependent RNA methyltransferase [Prolixibacteraceae bacterium]